MEYSFRFAHPFLLGGLILGIIIYACLRWFFYKPNYYKYPLAQTLQQHGYSPSSLFKIIPFILRLVSLLILACLVARPQWVDVKSKVYVEGIDIMLALDASGSMQCFDDLKDQRTRFDVAKQEAIHFIEKRPNDQIGLVLFGKDVISRCPLTLDKAILKNIITDLKLGDIDPDGTVLSMALAMAARRLQQSKAKSKIIIILTDGEPTPGLDIDPKNALEIAKKLGIKIYTIGIGGQHGGLIKDPLFGVRSLGLKLNAGLLKMIAQETGGHYFEAHKPDDVRRIYDTIDVLEKTEHQTELFTHFFDSVTPAVCIASLLLCAELIASLLVWFCV